VWSVEAAEVSGRVVQCHNVVMRLMAQPYRPFRRGSFFVVVLSRFQRRTFAQSIVTSSGRRRRRRRRRADCLSRSVGKVTLCRFLLFTAFDEDHQLIHSPAKIGRPSPSATSLRSFRSSAVVARRLNVVTWSNARHYLAQRFIISGLGRSPMRRGTSSAWVVRTRNCQYCVQASYTVGRKKRGSKLSATTAVRLHRFR